MTDKLNDIEPIVVKDEKLIEKWEKRSPRFERKYEKSVIRLLSDYGIGASENTSAKGKILGAGYEVYIMAFFIGLYSDRRLPLTNVSADVKDFGQRIQYWGNLDSKKNRHAYSGLRSYMFVALIAKTDIDWIAVDKGEANIDEAVRKIICTMEEYANYGFSVMEEKINEDSSYFFSHRSFLDIFMQLTAPSIKEVNDAEKLEEL